MSINSLLAQFGHEPVEPDHAKQATEENAGLLQCIAEAARQMALLTAYANAQRDNAATFQQLRPHVYQALALGQRMLHAADGWAPRVIARTVRPHLEHLTFIEAAPEHTATAGRFTTTGAAGLFWHVNCRTERCGWHDYIEGYEAALAACRAHTWARA